MSQSIIYIIDDHEAGRESLQALLNAHGHISRIFGSAQEFLSIKNRLETGCVITDLRMDGINGLDLLIQLREEQCPLPVILISAYATVLDAVQIMKNGALNLIQKPYQEHEILDTVNQALRINSQQIDQQSQRIVLNRLFTDLNEEEFQVVELIISGASNKMIALQLDVSARTIDRRRQTIFSKLNVDSVVELTTQYAEWSQNNSKHPWSI